MKRILGVLAVLALLAVPATLLAYSSTQSDSSSTAGWNKTFTFSSLPASAGTVTVEVTVSGDFGHSSEYADIYLDGTHKGTINPTPPGNVNCTTATGTFTTTASAVADGTLLVRIDATSAVDYSPCMPLVYSATVTYSSNTAPVLSSISDQTTPEDTSDSVGFTVSDAQDSNGSIAVSASSSNTSVINSVSATNSGGNGTVSWTPVGNATGTSTITVTATDSGGATDTESFVVTVTGVNDPPVADAGGAVSGSEGSPITVNGSGSSDIDNAITTYAWDCDNNGSYETSSSSATNTCTFNDNGTYTIGLRVTDASGATDTGTTTATVSNVAPVISSASYGTGNEGSPVSFSVAFTDAGAADTHSFLWNFGDSTTSSAASPTHTYADDGSYTVTVTVTDDDGGADTDTGTAVVGNVAPTITSVTAPDGMEGAPIAFSVSATDPGADTITFTWDFGDSGSATGASASHTYVDNGTYTVTVTANDGDGGTDSQTETVVVGNVAPVITSTSFGSGIEGDPIPFNVTWTDSSSADTHTVNWNFGDSSSGNGASPTHAYADDGGYSVTVTVTDDDGASDSVTGTAVITNGDPSILAISIPDGDEGELLTFTVNHDDPGAADTHTITWDFGDSGAATGASVTHAYADNGAYAVTVTVTDDDGGSASASDTSTISNVDPVITSIAGPTSGTEGIALSWTANVTDAGSADTHTYDFDFGDGSPVVSGASDTVSHAYEDNGTYTLTVTVTDDDGGSVTDTLTITIENGPPVIQSLTVPATADEGATVTMSVVATDSPSDTLTYDWEFGDTASGAGETVTHVYADDGLYTVTVFVTDDDGGSDQMTATITVVNVVPTITSLVVPAGDEGDVLALSAAATDPGADALTFDWDFGDSLTGVGETPTHTWADDGVYVVTLTVTDDDGGAVTQTGTAVIGNVAPSITSLVGPATGNEGDVQSFTVAWTDPGADTFTLLWDFGDGTPAVTGADVEPHLFTDDGTYTVTVTVTDDEGGADTSSTSITILNLDPTIDTLVAGSGAEGDTLTYDGLGLDAGDDTLTYDWDFGDGSPAVAGASPTHVYEDDGVYTVTLTITDEDGGSVTDTTTSTVTNVDPEVTSLTGPATGDEGSDLTFESAATDVGVADIPDLAFSWDFGDSGLGADTPIDHAFMDEGTYTVTVTVDDGDGGSATDTLTVDISNVAPEITSAAPAFASEAVLWSYQAVAVDPGDDTLTWSLSESAPDGMTLDPATGLLEWTPTYDQSLGGPYSATLTVDDGDGGTDVEVFTVVVGWADDDGDGMADEWELDNGLDPTDPSDAGGDPDMDGVTNLEEFEEGTDPNSFDGPTAPTLVTPIEGDEVATSTPDLVVENSWDPQLDLLTYDFEVYEDEAMSALVTLAGGAVPETEIETTWKVDVPLVENAEYWWRAAAFDGHAWGPWTDVESFVVNEFNEPPPAPVPLYPVLGETVASLDVELTWTGLDDPDGDALTFDVVVWDELMEVVLTEAYDLDFPEARDSSGAWLVDVGLDEDTWVVWEVRAVDEHGLAGDWSMPEDFFYDTSNAAPAGVWFIDPLDGDVVGTVSPVLLATEGVDPEEQALTYRFEVDTVATFDSAELVAADVPETLLGEVAWDLAGDGVELPEDVTVYARVRALDPAGVGSEWDVISFFVAGDNGAPAVPELLVPEDGAVLETSQPSLVIGNVLDPEGDLVFYDFVVARDFELTDIVTAQAGVLEGAGDDGDDLYTSWRSDLILEGTLYWSARAVDELGATSEWATAFSFTIDGGEVPPTDDDDDVTTGGAGCDCESNVGGGAGGSAALLLVLLGLGLRRRRE